MASCMSFVYERVRSYCCDDEKISLHDDFITGLDIYINRSPGGIITHFATAFSSLRTRGEETPLLIEQVT